MGRSHVTTTIQPDEVTCGPASIKHALQIFGIRKSVRTLSKLCKTTSRGTSTKNMIGALHSLGFSVLQVEKANLRHMLAALRYPSRKPRAVIVTYLYDLAKDDANWKNSGHWAAISSYSASRGRLSLFDSYSGKRKSYNWQDFRARWLDYETIKKRKSPRSKKFKVLRKWTKRLMLVVSNDPAHLPKFRTGELTVYPTAS
jgi:ABC-type bacteriocin/lantibiotic exporter with double-glycine peptidase domain